jgi:hypothetical protein
MLAEATRCSTERGVEPVTSARFFSRSTRAGAAAAAVSDLADTLPPLLSPGTTRDGSALCRAAAAGGGVAFSLFARRLGVVLIFALGCEIAAAAVSVSVSLCRFAFSFAPSHEKGEEKNWASSVLAYPS